MRRRRISERGRGHLQGGTEEAAGGGIDSPNKNGELISKPVSANAHVSSTVQKKNEIYRHACFVKERFKQNL